MKFDELIERVKPKSRKELPFFLLKAGVIILVVREFLYDISHVMFSKTDMAWLLVYLIRVLIFGVIQYILYRKVKKWWKKGPGHRPVCYIFLWPYQGRC
jgi:hypothetical protein